MTRHPTARRVHRTETSDDDVFVAGILESGAWAKQNARKLIIGSVALTAIVLVAVFWMLNRNARERQAAQQILPVRAMALAGQSAVAIPQLEEFVAQYGNTRHGGEGRMLLGQAYLAAGQPQQAVQAVSPLADNLRDDYGVNAAFLTAAAHEATQQWDRAEQEYRRIADNAPYAYQKLDAWDNIGRLRLQQGNAAGAVEAYTAAWEMTEPSTPERQVFELRRGEALALAASGGPAGAAGPAATDAPGTATSPGTGDAPTTPAAGDTTGS